MDGYKFERRVALFTAVFVVVSTVHLVDRNEAFRDPNLVVLIRIILAFAVGALGATIPGLLRVTYNAMGFAIRAAGGLALFVVTFFGTPHVESLHLVDNLKLQNEIVKHLGNRNNCSTALVEAQELVRRSPKDAIAWNLQGNAHYCLGNISEALSSFEFSAELDTSYRPALYNTAAALIRLGKYHHAEQLLDPLVRTDPDYISARYNLAVAQAALNRIPESNRNFEIVYERDQSFDAALGLGFVNSFEGGSPKKSIEYFKIATTIKPSVVCLLFGKLPIDPELQEESPFLDIFQLVKDSNDFNLVRASFDESYNRIACKDTDIDLS